MIADFENRLIRKILNKTELLSKSGYWYYDVSSNTISISENLAKILEIEKQSIHLPLFFSTFFQSGYLTLIKNIFNNSIENATDFEIELKLVTPEKNEKWVKIIGSPDIVKGSAIAIYGTISDITDNKNYEIILREKQKQFDVILNHNMQAYALLTNDKKIISFNEMFAKSALELFGFKVEIGSNLDKLLKGELKDTFNKKFNQCLQGEIVYSDRDVTDDSGEYKFINIAYVPIVSYKNSINSVLFVVNDVTLFKLREKHLEELSMVASSISNGVYIVNNEHKIVWANQAYENLIQQSQKDIYFTKPILLDSRLTSKKLVNDILKKIESNVVFKDEVYIKRKNGTFYWSNVSITPIFDDQNIFYQYIVIEDDITDKKNSEAYKKFFENQKKIRNAREQRIRTLAVLSGQEQERMKFSVELHEGVGQLLFATKMALGSLLNYSNELAFKTKINELEGNLESVIQSIRVISKDLSPSTLYDFGLDAAVEELITKYRNSTNIKFKYECSRNKQKLKLVYKVELFRMINEIVLNSIKHSLCNTIIIDITYTKKIIDISIIDDGIGFDKEAVKHKGNGLKNIEERARLLGAEVVMISRKGEGCVFSIELELKNE